MDDPRHVFLSASDVMARYGWGKTKGYQNLKDRSLVPAPALEALVAPTREEVTVTDLLPQPKRRRRPA